MIPVLGSGLGQIWLFLASAASVAIVAFVIQIATLVGLVVLVRWAYVAARKRRARSGDPRNAT
jgi:hypothetical protein